MALRHLADPPRQRQTQLASPALLVDAEKRLERFESEPDGPPSRETKLGQQVLESLLRLG